MEERALAIVFAGHIDHGKSTLIGRLYYDTGCLPHDKYEEIEKRSLELGRELEWAFIMDHLEEERRRGITIDIAHTFFKTDKRKYVIIDAPGHKEFLKNMITGSSQAEAALLLIDISEGIREQTRRHCYMLSLLGIKQVAVVVNKMDMIDFSKNDFENIRDEINSLMNELGLKPDFIIPISARTGENVAKRTDKLSWFHGPTILEALDNFDLIETKTKGLRFPVQDVYQQDDGLVVVGRIEAGKMEKGRTVSILPEGATCTIDSIIKYHEELERAYPGECIGIRVDGIKLERGQVLVDDDTVTITDSINANVFWLFNSPYTLGIPLDFRLATQGVKCEIKKISSRYDPGSMERVDKESTGIFPSEVAEVEIKLEKPIVIDKFSDVPEMGRFILEHSGYPVAGGIVI